MTALEGDEVGDVDIVKNSGEVTLRTNAENFQILRLSSSAFSARFTVSSRGFVSNKIHRRSRSRIRPSNFAKCGIATPASAARRSGSSQIGATSTSRPST